MQQKEEHAIEATKCSIQLDLGRDGPLGRPRWSPDSIGLKRGSNKPRARRSRPTGSKMSKLQTSLTERRYDFFTFSLWYSGRFPGSNLMPSTKIIPRKNLGQNFLRDVGAIRKIVSSLDLRPDDFVLEIGCGTGALTQHLAGKARKFVGVELDPVLSKRLEASFESSNTVILNQNVLTEDLEAIVRKYFPKLVKVKVVGNLPYYISSPIIEWLARQSGLLEIAIVMLQAEVADRLVASPGGKDYGVLTLTANYHFKCKKLFSIKPKSFWPVPKVDSTVVQLIPKSSKDLDSTLEPEFFAFVKECFSHRRKTLKNCIKKKIDNDPLEAALKRLNYPLDVRAERISLEDFITLFCMLWPQKAKLGSE